MSSKLTNVFSFTLVNTNQFSLIKMLLTFLFITGLMQRKILQMDIIVTVFKQVHFSTLREKTVDLTEGNSQLHFRYLTGNDQSTTCRAFGQQACQYILVTCTSGVSLSFCAGGHSGFSARHS